MEKFVIQGGRPLYGSVSVSGAKNAAVAIIPACILSDGVCRIENIPNILDVSSIVRILHQLGADIRMINKSTLEIDCSNIRDYVVPDDLVRKIRASAYFMGALLGKFSKARVSMPGGCDFGVRPIDQHIKGFEALGASVSLVRHGMIDIHAEKLTGSQIYLDVVSVGATVNIMLAAVKAEGLTVIENAAKEPHIVDLANFLNSMGADIMGAGTDVIKIRGVKTLKGTTYSIIPDQIEAGTYMVAAAATGGDVTVHNVIPKHLEAITAKLIELGVDVAEGDDSVRVRRTGQLQKCNIKTMPHPGFPTDLHPPVAVLLALANGTSIINESVWENRFRYVEELRRMGAQVQVDGKIAVFEGVKNLTGACVKCSDLRAGAALVIAGLAAVGTTEIEDIQHIERGYEDIEAKLESLGASIKRVRVKEPSMAKAL